MEKCAGEEDVVSSYPRGNDTAQLLDIQPPSKRGDTRFNPCEVPRLKLPFG